VVENEWESGITVAIPTLSEEEYITETLDSLQQRLQELHDGFDTELIIIDGDSDDGTVEICEEHDAVEEVYICSDEGVMCARDAAMVAATYSIVVHGDADTRYHEDWLNHLIAPFSDPEVGLVYGKVKGEGYEKHLRQLYQRFNNVAFGNYAPGQNRAVRQTAYDAAGGLDLDHAQESGPRTSLEEEIRFPNRVEEHFGKVVYAKQAVCTTSGRNIESIVTGSEKSGGAQWKEVNAGGG